jgi:hypothetical protein
MGTGVCSLNQEPLAGGLEGRALHMKNEKSVQEEKPPPGAVVQRYLLQALSISGNPPKVDARGVGIGLLVALGLPVGTHTLALAMLRPLVRYNVGLAFAVTWVVNPFTVVPLYWAYYCLGALFLNDSSTVNIEAFRQVLEPILHADHFLAGVKEFLRLDLEILERWAIGAAFVSIPLSVVGYVVTYRIQTRRRVARGDELS